MIVTGNYLKLSILRIATKTELIELKKSFSIVYESLFSNNFRAKYDTLII